MTTNTRDLSKFGFREYDIAGDLLKALANNKWQKDSELNDGIVVEFNPNSGEVFLVDEDYNVAMLNSDGELENWLSCSNCGYEAFRTDEVFDGYTGDTCNNCADNK